MLGRKTFPTLTLTHRKRDRNVLAEGGKGPQSYRSNTTWQSQVRIVKGRVLISPSAPGSSPTECLRLANDHGVYRPRRHRELDDSAISPCQRNTDGRLAVDLDQHGVGESSVVEREVNLLALELGIGRIEEHRHADLASRAAPGMRVNLQ